MLIHQTFMKYVVLDFTRGCGFNGIRKSSRPQRVHTLVYGRDNKITHAILPQKWVAVQLLSHVWLLVTPWTAAHQTCLSSTISGSLLKFMSIELVMLSNLLILCCPLLLLPSISPIIGIFSSESTLHIRWPKYWSFSFKISNDYLGLIFFPMII